MKFGAMQMLVGSFGLLLQLYLCGLHRGLIPVYFTFLDSGATAQCEPL